MFYIVGTGLVKVSFGFTLLRFLQDPWQRVVVKLTIIPVIVFTDIFFFVFAFGCQPFEYNWTRRSDPYYIAATAGIDPKRLNLVPKGWCASVKQIELWNYAHASVMIFADLILGIIIPTLVIRNLNVKRSLKITTWAILGLGALASVATIIRFTYVHRLLDLLNFYVLANPCLLWSFIEYGLCLVGANCTTLKPLAKKIRLFSDNSGPEGVSPMFAQQQRQPADPIVDSSSESKPDTWAGKRFEGVENQLENGRGLVLPREPMDEHGASHNGPTEVSQSWYTHGP